MSFLTTAKGQERESAADRVKREVKCRQAEIFSPFVMQYVMKMVVMSLEGGGRD